MQKADAECMYDRDVFSDIQYVLDTMGAGDAASLSRFVSHTQVVR